MRVVSNPVKQNSEHTGCNRIQTSMAILFSLFWGDFCLSLSAHGSNHFYRVYHAVQWDRQRNRPGQKQKHVKSKMKNKIVLPYYTLISLLFFNFRKLMRFLFNLLFSLPLFLLLYSYLSFSVFRSSVLFFCSSMKLYCVEEVFHCI